MNEYRTARIASPLLLILFLCSAAAGDYEWKPRKEKQGITVHTRNVPGSDSLEFRAVAEIETTMECLLNIMEDVNSYTEIFPSVREAKLLGMIDSREPVLYQLIGVPAPAKNRDTIVKVAYRRNPGTGAVTLTMTSLWDYLPERKNTVRVKRVSGRWEFVPNSGRGTVRVTYQLHNDPGGTLPPWLVNVAVVKRPFNVLRNLRKMVKKPKYRDARSGDLRFFK